jgi:alanine dehydrogenase
VRSWHTVVRVFSRSAENRARFVARMQPQVLARIVTLEEPRAVATGADLICLATGSNVPVLFGDWLEPGQHVTSIVASNRGVFLQGSVSRPRREFDDAVIARADRVVATLKEQAIMDEQADLFEPVENGITSWDEIADLGELVAGKVPGRRSPEEITVFKQNSDQGVGFMALAKLAHDKARAAGLGIEI